MLKINLIDGERDYLPTNNEKNVIKKLVAKALNDNQKLILFSIDNNEKESMNSMLTNISKEYSISLSTLKLNVKILRNFGLINSNGFIEITESGLLIKDILKHR